MGEKGLKILVIDDVAEWGECLAVILRGVFGESSVEAVTSGFQARVALARRRPDVVLLDHQLGLESVDDLARECSEQGISGIWVSATPLKAIGALKGWDRYWQKPQSLRDMRDIKDLLMMLTGV